MIKSTKIAGYELRRFKGPLPVAALVFLVLVPLIYGGLHLWSVWDPYGKIDQVPVAVVNQDVAVDVDGKSVDAGNRLVAEFKAEKIFDWRFVDADQAASGLADGTYAQSITIPPDFSASLASGATQNPTRALILLHRDDVNGYAVGMLNDSVGTRLEAMINRAAIGAYFESVFANLDTIRTDIGTSATTAGALAASAGAAQTGVTDVSTALTAAKDSSTQLVTSLADTKTSTAGQVTAASDAKAASASVVSGLATVESGVSQLGSAAQDVATGTQQLASTVVPVLNAVSSLLPAIGQAGANVSAATSDVSGLVTQSLSPQVSAANAALTALKTINTHPELDSTIDALSSALDGITSTTTDLGTASSQASQAAVAVNSAAESVNTVGGGGVSGTDITALATGAAQVATGVAAVSSGITTAGQGASTVDGSIGQLSTGATDLDTKTGQLQLDAQKLDDGLGVAQTGATTLVEGITGLNTGATQLSTDLAAEAKRIPTLTPDQRSDAAQVLSSPAQVQTTIDNPAVFYGRGLSPLIVGIAIWIFALVAFGLLRPVSQRALAGRAPSTRIAFAGWLPFFWLGGVGSLMLFGVLWLGLQLNPVNAGGSVGVVLLAAGCFTAITHLLRTWLGKIGSAVSLVLLIVQATGAAGLYPVQTLPTAFQSVHPFLPMTYLVDALRITFTGGPTDHLWRDVAVLAGITVIAIVATMLVVHRKRLFRVRDLHPVLA